MRDQTPQARLTWLDASGNQGYTYLHFDQGEEPATIAGALVDVRSALGDLSDARLVAQELFYFAKEVPPGSPAGDAGVQDAAVFVFETSEPDSYELIYLPALTSGFYLIEGPTAGIDVDLTLPAVQDFITWCLSRRYCNQWGFNLTACVAAFKTSRP